jgi:hypothetical protein
VVQAGVFRAHQQQAVDQVRGQLWGHWLPKSLDVFRRLPAVPINNDAAAYFRCARQRCALAGNALRWLRAVCAALCVGRSACARARRAHVCMRAGA